MIRDGAGMIGRITFSWYQGTDLDCNSKFWRMFADVTNDIAFAVDILSPQLPQYTHLPLMCGSMHTLRVTTDELQALF